MGSTLFLISFFLFIFSCHWLFSFGGDGRSPLQEKGLTSRERRYYILVPYRHPTRHGSPISISLDILGKSVKRRSPHLTDRLEPRAPLMALGLLPPSRLLLARLPVCLSACLSACLPGLGCFVTGNQIRSSRAKEHSAPSFDPSTLRPFDPSTLRPFDLLVARHALRISYIALTINGQCLYVWATLTTAAPCDYPPTFPGHIVICIPEN
jgi:hypothetical protein